MAAAGEPDEEERLPAGEGECRTEPEWEWLRRGLVAGLDMLAERDGGSGGSAARFPAVAAGGGREVRRDTAERRWKGSSTGRERGDNALCSGGGGDDG